MVLRILSRQGHFSDSLLVNVDLFSATKENHYAATLSGSSDPNPEIRQKFSVTVKTLGKAGVNDVTVFVNPQTVAKKCIMTIMWLALYGHLVVQADKNGPVLDVDR